MTDSPQDPTEAPEPSETVAERQARLDHEPALDAQPTEPSGAEPTQPLGPQPTEPSGAEPTQPLGPPTYGSEEYRTSEQAQPKRYSGVGVIAALAVAALVGGVSGAGVAVWAVTANQDSHTVASANGTPSTITVNDAADATRITAVAAAASPSVVTISVAGSNAAGTGSGVIFTEDGYILTNTHVVTLDGHATNTKIKVQSYDGRLFNATLIGADPITDLAVIKIKSDSTLQAAQFADSAKLNVGDAAIAIGAPLGLANTVTNGIVSALNRSITVSSSAAPKGDSTTPKGNGSNGPFEFWPFGTTPNQPQNPSAPQAAISLPVIQTDAAINPGNSGGALLGSDGKVIGINVAIASANSRSGSTSTAGSIGVGFAIPSNLAKRIAYDLKDNGSATHGLLGATVMDATGDTSLTNNATVGASIQSVTNGGAAQKAGLQKGDVVIRFNGLPITDGTDLTAQVRALAAGTTAELAYVRDGRSATVTVTLGELK